MRRLQRTCLIASVFSHGLVLVIVLVSSAFVSKPPPVDSPAFELIEIPKNLVDEPNVIGGGNPNITVPQIPAALPPQPAAPAEAKPTEAVEMPREAPKESPKETPKEAPKPEEPVKAVEAKPDPKPEPKNKQPDPDSFDLSKAVKKTPPKPEKAASTFDFGKAEKKVIKPSNTAKEGKETTEGEESRGAKEQRFATARVGAIGDALKRVQGGLSSVGGSYEVPGPGGNSMSYTLALQKRYRDAWVGAQTAGRNGVMVEVEIAKDGTILSAIIIRKSGNTEYDRAAQITINRVRKVDPLPEGTKETKRTYRFEITPNELERG